MKKTFKTIASLVMALTMIMGMSLTAFAADSSVTHEGGAEDFVFLPGSAYTDTDLFDSFKGVMPGDVLTEEIVVQNKFAGSDYVRIYMRAVAHDEAANPLSPSVAQTETVVSMSDFLSQLSMTVKQGDKVLFNASPDELDGLKENVLLGEFDPNESTKLTVELTVPIELGNEYAYRVGEVDWIFMVEELNNPDAPQTGDQMDIMLVTGVLVASVLVMAAVLLMKRRKQQ